MQLSPEALKARVTAAQKIPYQSIFGAVSGPESQPAVAHDFSSANPLSLNNPIKESSHSGSGCTVKEGMGWQSSMTASREAS